MPALTINAAGVAAANTNTVTATALAGAAISAGQVVWLDTSSSPSVLRLAQATSQTQAINVVGVALDSAAGANQSISYATSGDILLPTTGVNTSLTSGSVYVLGNNPGDILAAIELTAGYATLLGLAMNSTTLRLNTSTVGAPR